MHPKTVIRIVGMLLIAFSSIYLFPIGLAFWYDEHSLKAFSWALAITFGSGLILWLPCRHTRSNLSLRDGFLVTSLFWLVLSLYGATPLFLSQDPSLSFTNAFFEATSGLTTTGATVLTHIDDLPRSILFYRQLLQWLGGIGIILIAVSILPLLGIHGSQLYRAEMSNAIGEQKLTPRINETAKLLFLIYSALTLLCAFCYYLAGMSLFDAISHSLSTVSIGGFSTHNKSLGYFDGTLVPLVAIFFMLICSINFALHFYSLKRFSMAPYRKDSELRFFISVLFGAVAICTIALLPLRLYDVDDSILHAVFQAVSITTTSGFVTTDFSQWPGFLPWLLIFLACGGACAGSTGGGIKAVRVLLICKQGLREIKQLTHPAGVFPLKLHTRIVPQQVMDGLWSFISVYLLVFVLITLLLLATGLDFSSSFAATAATLNNLGPGLGSVAHHYQDISDVAKWILCISMLLGRLEIFTLLALLTPTFWRS